MRNQKIARKNGHGSSAASVAVLALCAALARPVSAQTIAPNAAGAPSALRVVYVRRNPVASAPRSVRTARQADATPPQADATKPVGFSTLDFAVPESPAFIVLGVSPENVVRPTSPRAFATSLLNGLDQEGNLQNGVALEAVPYTLARGTEFTLAEYRADKFKRFLANTSLSLGTIKGAGTNDDAARLGVGIHTILYNQGDSRMDNQLIADFKKILESQPNPDQDLDLFDQQIAGKLKKVRDAARKRSESKPIWTLAFAPSWISPDGKYGNLKSNGMGLWTSFSTGIGGDSQLIAHVRYRTNEEVADPDNAGMFLGQDTSLAGLRLRTGGQDFRFSFETSYINRKRDGSRTDDSLAFGVGLEPRISEGLWLNISFTGEAGRRDGNDGRFQTALKWAFDAR